MLKMLNYRQKALIDWRLKRLKLKCHNFYTKKQVLHIFLLNQKYFDHLVKAWPDLIKPDDIRLKPRKFHKGHCTFYSGEFILRFYKRYVPRQQNDVLIMKYRFYGNNLYPINDK